MNRLPLQDILFDDSERFPETLLEGGQSLSPYRFSTTPCPALGAPNPPTSHFAVNDHEIADKTAKLGQGASGDLQAGFSPHCLLPAMYTLRHILEPPSPQPVPINKVDQFISDFVLQSLLRGTKSAASGSHQANAFVGDARLASFRRGSNIFCLQVCFVFGNIEIPRAGATSVAKSNELEQCSRPIQQRSVVPSKDTEQVASSCDFTKKKYNRVRRSHSPSYVQRCSNGCKSPSEVNAENRAPFTGTALYSLLFAKARLEEAFSEDRGK